MQTKTNIKAEIIADSINQQGDRITTYLLTFPRFILSELNTHRVFSKNSASSRAIPFEKMVEMVETDPFIPIAWQKDHKGMQGTEYITDSTDIELNRNAWLRARDSAVSSAKYLNHGVKEGRDNGVTKQLCNRLLEPFMWHTVLLTGTEWENFFKLRCPQYVEYAQFAGGKLVFRSKKEYIDTLGKGDDYSELDWFEINEGQAEIHMMALAEAMWDAMNESTPKELKAGEWHIPFGDRMQDRDIMQHVKGSFNSRTEVEEATQKFKIKIAVARCARLSYNTFDGEIDYEKDIKLHDSLLTSQHASPFEHCCRVLTKEEYNILGKMVLHSENGYVFENGWVDNFKGFISYRRILNI